MPVVRPYTSENDLITSLQAHHLLTQHIVEAMKLAKFSHTSQVRDSGKPYLEEHVYSIAHALLFRHVENDNLADLIVVALLHDAVEDSYLDEEILIAKFGGAIATYVCALTKNIPQDYGQLSQEEKFEFTRTSVKKIERAGEIAIKVKLEDRLNNLRSTGNVNQKPAKYKRYNREIRELFIPLAAKYAAKYIPLYEQELLRIDQALAAI